MFSFPPYTQIIISRCVNGPFKIYCANAQDNWIRNNPGKIITIYDLPGIVKKAPLAATPINIKKDLERLEFIPLTKISLMKLISHCLLSPIYL